MLYLSELGEDDYETRKVQLYRDGRAEWADEQHETASIGLAEIPFPSIDDISSQSDCRAELITSQEFERAWRDARAEGCHCGECTTVRYSR